MRRLALGLLALGYLTLTACHGTIGGVLADTTNTLILPSVMQSGDPGVGCATGEALGSMVGAYAPYSRKALRASVVSTLSAGMCLDDDVWEAELDAARALHRGDVTAAKDARIREARAHEVAAQRYHAAFLKLDAAYGVPQPGEDCPRLKKTSDQFTYMMGLSSGLLAVIHDAGAQGAVGVPLDIPAAVVRGANCLDDDAWWGVPKAMQAAMLVLQPDHPDAKDPWGTLDASAAKGRAARVRLAGSFAAQAASSVGDAERLQGFIAQHAEAIGETPRDPAWAMLDAYATQLVQHESDRLWAEATGHRTPFGELGTFPGTAAAGAPTELSDDLLDGLLDDTDTTP